MSRVGHAGFRSIVTRKVTVQRTPRSHQVCGKFDLPTDGTTVREWKADVELPAVRSVGHVGVQGQIRLTVLPVMVSGNCARDVVVGVVDESGNSIQAASAGTLGRTH